MKGLLYPEITGKWILERMRSKSVSVHELASKMNVSRQSVEKWLSGAADPSEKNRAKLKEILE